MKRKKTKYEISELPLYCDFTCQFAEFAPPESVGACRKDIAVYCLITKKFNNKHTICMVRKEVGEK